MSDQFENKKHVSMFFTARECPLKHTDLLVYCYRAHQDSFETRPSCRRTAKSTGIKEETVSSASERLRQYGLLDGDFGVVTPCPKMEWFQQSDALVDKFMDRHFSMWLRNWRCYIRKPGFDNPLTVASVMVYSLIRNSVLNRWKPPDGWSHEYMSLVTRLSPKTVSTALERLEQLGFLAVLDGMRFRLYRLRESQLGCFADKRQYSGNATSEPDEMIDEFSPVSRTLDERDAARQQLTELLKRFPIDKSDKDRIYGAVTGMKGWPKGWFQAADQMVDRVLTRYSR